MTAAGSKAVFVVTRETSSSIDTILGVTISSEAAHRMIEEDAAHVKRNLDARNAVWKSRYDEALEKWKAKVAAGKVVSPPPKPFFETEEYYYEIYGHDISLDCGGPDCGFVESHKVDTCPEYKDSDHEFFVAWAKDIEDEYGE